MYAGTAGADGVTGNEGDTDIGGCAGAAVNVVVDTEGSSVTEGAAEDGVITGCVGRGGMGIEGAEAAGGVGAGMDTGAGGGMGLAGSTGDDILAIMANDVR